MLKSISIKNYKTFIGETYIDFAATNYKFLEDENVGAGRVLKGALFVGENASGKTNILHAITLLLQICFRNESIDYAAIVSFYGKYDQCNIKYNFYHNGNDIDYLLTISRQGIEQEQLIRNGETLLSRNSRSGNINMGGHDTVVDELPKNLALLRRTYFDTHFYDDKILSSWFEYLRQSVYVNCNTHSIISFTNDTQELNAYVYLEKNGVKSINDFLKKINYRQSISYDTETHNKRGNFNSGSSKKFISFAKEGTGLEIPDTYESTGNITLVSLLPAFIHAIKNDCMLIVDEFSSGFHNELEECLVKYFYHYSNNSQLFLVTHSTNILNNSIVRPDQVYSVRFDGKNGSVIKRFSDEMPREAQNIEKMYLNGVFDAKPYYNKIFKD